MTLIELVTTIAILGVLLVLSIGPFQALQARQSLRQAQEEIQSSIGRMQQLSLAPPALATDSTIVGYGLAFYPTSQMQTKPTFQNDSRHCTVNTTADFVALFKFVRDTSTNSQITPLFNSFEQCDEGRGIDPADYPSDFYLMPAGVTFVPQDSTPSAMPWLLPIALQSTRDRYGDLGTAAAYVGGDWHNPLPSARTKAVLALQHSSVSAGNRHLACIILSRERNSVALATELSQTCSIDAS